MGTRLEYLRTDYAAVIGTPFQHFFCPILYVDEDVPTCMGHIVNKAFPNVSHATTVQRVDVDSFYGTHFESEFIKLQYQDKSLKEMLSDSKLRRIIKFTLFVNDTEYECYEVNGKIPKSHQPFVFSFAPDRLFAVKASPEDAAMFLGANSVVDWRQNLTLYAFPTLLKAAHLTMFHMVGYKYVFSTAGRFLGRILRAFFLQNRNKTRKEIRREAETYFQPYREMVRPSEALDGWAFEGTVADNIVLLCRNSNHVVWGKIVFVNISTKVGLQSVLLPVENEHFPAESAITFGKFLLGKVRDFEVAPCRFEEIAWNLEPNCWIPVYWTPG